MADDPVVGDELSCDECCFSFDFDNVLLATLGISDCWGFNYCGDCVRDLFSDLYAESVRNYEVCLMPYYNVSGLVNATTPTTLIKVVNGFTGGFFVDMFTVALFFVFTFILSRWGFDRALAASGFLCFLLAAMLAFAGLVHIVFVLAFLAIMLFAVLFIIFIE